MSDRVAHLFPFIPINYLSKTLDWDAVKIGGPPSRSPEIKTHSGLSFNRRKYKNKTCTSTSSRCGRGRPTPVADSNERSPGKEGKHRAPLNSSNIITLTKHTTTMTSNNGYLKNDETFSTRAIHEGNEPEQWNSLAVVPPISMATTFKQDGPAEFKFFEYGRSGNPTRGCLEKCLASIENGKHGLAFASGLAATTTITHLLSAGDHIVSMDDLYGGTNRYFRTVASRMGVQIDFIDATDTKKVEAAMKPNTKMVWIETPTNPTLKIVDIAAVVAIVKKKSDCFLVVDNTFMSPYFQRPLDLGADLVMSSVTKYINGHTDVIMGCICTKRDDLHERLRFLQNAIGPVPSPFDCYLVNRSIKTLALRMEKHMQNGLAVARFLENHPCVEKVIHPGLPSHPQYELSKRQCHGHSGMLSFYIKGNNLEVSKKFFQKLKVFTLAESLGGYESLCELPSVMTHASVPKETRDKLGITDGLIRVSCGLEGADDLIKDLDQALRAVVSV